MIGASRDRRKFGNKALRAFREQGFTVVPIHPTEAEVEGEKAYPSVLDYPGAIDEATVYLHAEASLPVLDEIAQKGIAVLWLNLVSGRLNRATEKYAEEGRSDELNVPTCLHLDLLVRT